MARLFSGRLSGSLTTAEQMKVFSASLKKAEKTQATIKIAYWVVMSAYLSKEVKRFPYSDKKKAEQVARQMTEQGKSKLDTYYVQLLKE